MAIRPPKLSQLLPEWEGSASNPNSETFFWTSNDLLS